MDKNITLTVSLEKVSERAEKEFIEKAQEMAEWFTAVYGATVSLTYTPKR